jgi:sugar O-acyltransferase (sialic acid O-acetyltransferase NeuD family)
MKRLIIAGASNPDSVQLIDDINAHSKEWDLVGFVDDNEAKWKTQFYGYPVLGGIDILQEPEYQDVLTVCFIYGGSILTREKVVRRMTDMKLKFATLIHPSVSVQNVRVGHGCVIKRGCVLTYGTSIGNHSILGFETLVGHDAVIEDLVFCSPRASIMGRAHVGFGATIGAGAIINGDIHVGDYAMVGLGAVVFKNVLSKSTIVGNPGRVIVRDSTHARHPL